jgi:hypothetical protein
MKNSLIYKYFYLCNLTIKKYSLLRISQILEIKKINLIGSCLDVGSSYSLTNVTNYLKTKKKIFYLNNFSKKREDIKINLEIYYNYKKKKFKNIFLMNVLEHIKNTKNCLKNCYSFLEIGGKLFGSTPFIYKIHPSPNDYCRFTKSFLEEMLAEVGFKNIKVFELGGGIFSCFYTLIFDVTKRIPLLNIFIVGLCLCLDKFIYILFTRNLKKINPIGYFFTAKK